MRCCVPFCRTTAEVVSESEITFHEFPREVHLRAAWLRALGKQDTPLPDPAVVCSQHFLNDDIYETESGSRRIRTGAVPSAVLVCMMCLDTRSKLVLISKYKLEEAYEHLVGYPLCGQGKLKETLCVQCARRLADFSALRDQSLRVRRALTDLLDRHEVITIRHVKLISRVKHQLQSDTVIGHCSASGRTELDATATVATATAATATATAATATATGATLQAIAVKQEVEHHEDANTVPFDFETHISEPESSTHCNPAFVAPTVPAPRHGDEEHPTDTNDWDISSFQNNTNIFEDSSKPQRTVPKESLTKTSASINTRTTRQSDIFKNKQNSRDIFSTQSENYTDQIQYICDVCQKIFQRKSSLVTHIRAHTGAKTLSSQLRKRKLSQNSTLSKTHTGEKPFTCELCDYKCTVNSRLVSHMRTHTGEKPFACKLCKYTCTQNSNLVKHMRTHTGEKPFACKFCKYKCTRNSTLMIHMRTHTGEKPFACKLCKYKCSENRHLVLHMRTHTGEKPFACKLCKYTCTQNSNLVKHMRTHTGEKPFACKLCKYTCTHNSNLVKHMRTHSGEKPFACKLCKYKCTENGSLVRHMRTHTGENPFACKLCKYKCTENGSLVIHMRTHTGEKPFACKLCTYKCTQKICLVNHMRTHTGEKPFACKLCKYKCTQNGSLMRHMRTHTGE